MISFLNLRANILLSPVMRMIRRALKRDRNFIKLTDSYKLTHWLQYPPGTTKVVSYLESRGGEFEEMVFFGLLPYLKEYLEGTVLSQWMIEDAEEFCGLHYGDKTLFNRVGWQRMLDKHGGRIPVTIRAVPEGTVLPVKNVLAIVENTDPEFPWITNVLETLLLKVWYPCTVATLSREAKKVILAGLEKSGDKSLISCKLHDFGYRGVSSEESAAYGAAAHLVNFMGTDTIAGITLCDEIYGEKMAGYSIPASEHSTITAWGLDHEVDACRNMLLKYPKGLVACVSDSKDIYNCCANIWGGVLKELVLAREGTLVIRPDSGDAVTALPRILNILWDKFGGTVNAKGYKVLDPHVRVIWGDGCNLISIGLMIEAIMAAGFSVDNVAFGMGGGLLQMCHRDSMKFAFKCSYAVVYGVGRDVYKDPIDDHGKMSKRGMLVLVVSEDEAGERTFQTMREEDMPDAQWDYLEEAFRDGYVLTHPKLAEIRARAEVREKIALAA